MVVAIRILHKKARLNTSQIIKIVRKILNYQKVDQAVISLAFVTSQKITALNRKFLNRYRATDVLAFDLGGGPGRVKKALEGEIVISFDAAFKQARDYGTTFEQELVLYIIHGILHLLGYDDHRAADIKRMRKKEEELFKKVKKEIGSVLRS